jgi:hypothetical protein
MSPDIFVQTANMPSRRSRSRSRSRHRSRSPEKRPEGVPEISESDYFLKSSEFRVWLKDERGKVCTPRTVLDVASLIYGMLRNRKYFDEISGDKARR